MSALPPIACACLWSATILAAQAQGKLDPRSAEFSYQFRNCTITTTEPIYKSDKAAACGVASITRYSDFSCPVQTYESCQHESHGIDVWVDITGNPGSNTTRWNDGLSSAEGCLVEGEAWIQRTNAGQLPRQAGVAPLGDGQRYFLIEVEWESEDHTFLGHRMKAYHRCTFKYGIQRARYVDSRSSACDVESRTDCRTRTTYNECRHSSFGIESYRKAEGRYAQCGLRLDKGLVGVSYGGYAVSATPVGPVDLKIAGTCATVSDATARAICIRTNRRALDVADSVGTAYGDAVLSDLRNSLDQAGQKAIIDALTGDMRVRYDQMRDAFGADMSLAGSSDDRTTQFRRDFDNAVDALNDDTYFAMALRLATMSLTGPPLAGKDDADGLYYHVVWRFVTIHELSARRVPFKAYSDLQVLLRATDPAASPRTRGQALLFSEYFVRLVAAYVDGRAADILKLQAEESRLRQTAPVLGAVTAELAQRVREMRFPPAVEAAAIEQLGAATGTDKLQSVLRELVNVAKSDIKRTIEDSERFVNDMAAKDPLFRVHMASLHLLQGNVNHAVLQVRQSALAYEQLPKPTADSIRAADTFELTKRNIGHSVTSSLEAAQKTMDSLSTDSELSLDLLGISAGRGALSYRLMDALEKANAAVGDKLDGVRLELINLISTNVVTPLQAAEADLK